MLTERLGVTRGTAGAITSQLAEHQLITVDTRPVRHGSGQGRPSHGIAVHPRAPVVVAAHLHSDSFHVALATLGGTILQVTEGDLGGLETPHQVLAALVEAGNVLLNTCPRRCVGVGLALPSAVSSPDLTVLFAPHLGWGQGTPAGELFHDELARNGPRGPHGDPLPWALGNDANLEALAEYRHGAGQDTRHLLHVTTGHRGVGGALVLDGRLHTGSRGLALEVGHIVAAPEGRHCSCGSRGCLEVETDPSALVRAAGADPVSDAPLPPASQATAVLQRAAAGEPNAEAAVARVAERLGMGLGSLVNILNPDRITLGGLHADLVRAAPEHLTQAISARSLWGEHAAVPVRAVELARPALVGAAELAWQPLLDDPLAVLDG